MKLVAFETTREVTRFDSRGATIAGIARGSGAVQVSLLQLAAGGVLGMHPAACPQLFLVVAGSGWVRSRDGARQPLEPGWAALWKTGEPHESGSEHGLTAVVVEADSLELLGPG